MAVPYSYHHLRAVGKPSKTFSKTMEKMNRPTKFISLLNNCFTPSSSWHSCYNNVSNIASDILLYIHTYIYIIIHINYTYIYIYVYKSK